MAAMSGTKRSIARPGKESDRAIADSMGLTVPTVGHRRRKPGIPPFTKPQAFWTPAMIPWLGREPGAVSAKDASRVVAEFNNRDPDCWPDGHTYYAPSGGGDPALMKSAGFPNRSRPGIAMSGAAARDSAGLSLRGRNDPPRRPVPRGQRHSPR